MAQAKQAQPPKGKDAAPKEGTDKVVQPKLVADLVLAPSARVWTRWTPTTIEYAVQRAEAGDLSSAVQICDWLLRDDRVKATLDARFDNLFALDVSFEAADASAQKPKTKKGAAPQLGAKKKVKPPPAPPKNAPEAPPEEIVDLAPENDPILEALDHDWDLAYPENELKLIAIWGALLGSASFRHETVRDPETDRLLPCPRLFHPGTLKQDRRTEVWSVRDINGREYILTPGDGEWGLHCPYGKHRPWAQGLWMALADLVLLKQYARQDWARTSEKGALLVGEVQLDKDGNLPAGVDQKADFVNKLANRGGDAAAAMPPGWVLKLLQVADNYAIFKEQIDMINDAIATLVRGGNLTTEAGGGDGSDAATSTQAATGDAPKRRADGKYLSTTLRMQSVVWWTAWNFGQPSQAPWPLWSAPTSPPEVNFFSFMQGLAKGDEMGFTYDVETLKNDYGLGFISGYDPSKADRIRAEDNAAKMEQIGAKAEAKGPPGKEPPDAKPAKKAPPF